MFNSLQIKNIKLSWKEGLRNSWIYEQTFFISSCTFSYFYQSQKVMKRKKIFIALPNKSFKKLSRMVFFPPPPLTEY